MCATYTCIEVGFDDDLQVLVMPDMRLFHSKNTKLEVDLRKFLLPEASVTASMTKG